MSQATVLEMRIGLRVRWACSPGKKTKRTNGCQGDAKQEKRNVSYIVGDWLGRILEIRVRTALQGLSMSIWVAPAWGGIIKVGKMGATVR